MIELGLRVERYPARGVGVRTWEVGLVLRRKSRQKH